MLRWAKVLILVAGLGIAGVPQFVVAADMPQQSVSVPRAQVTEALTSYLQRRAVLLQLRARFQVISSDDIPAILAAEAAGFAETGPTDQAIGALEAELLAEGSYYVVSLRYLIEAGGSLWPEDKDETTYINDALVKLRDLQAELPELIASGADPLDFFVRLDGINSWTEGYAEVPSELDHFSGRDALVEAALASIAPVSI